jgi:hypothetical protein
MTNDQRLALFDFLRRVAGWDCRIQRVFAKRPSCLGVAIMSGQGTGLRRRLAVARYGGRGNQGIANTNPRNLVRHEICATELLLRFDFASEKL